MRVSSRATGAAAVIAVLVAAALAAGGCGDGGPETTAPEPVSTASVPSEPAPIREREDLDGDDSGDPSTAGGDGDAQAAPPAGADEEVAERALVRKAQSAYRRYLAAVNTRDGAALCRLLAPGFEDELELPEQGSSCAERLSRSIGYEDPRGSPVWKATELDTLESAIVDDAGRVQLSVAIATRFADRGETSVESDIAFLEPAGGGAYVLAKAPGSLWRAVGKPDVPPTVITPPPGF